MNLFLLEFEKNDPPDVWVYDKNQNKVALEITELVNEAAIDADICGKPEYGEECKKWSDIDYFRTQLNQLNSRKTENVCQTF